MVALELWNFSSRVQLDISRVEQEYRNSVSSRAHVLYSICIFKAQNRENRY